MTALYVVLSMVALGLFNYFMGKYLDQKTMIQLQEFLLIGPKKNPYVNMYRFMGYSGGWAEFTDKKFSFSFDESLYAADKLISNSPPFKVVSREQG